MFEISSDIWAGLIHLLTVISAVLVLKKERAPNKKLQNKYHIPVFLIAIIYTGFTILLSKSVERESAASERNAIKRESAATSKIVHDLERYSKALMADNIKLTSLLTGKTDSLSSQFGSTTQRLINQMDLSTATLNQVISGGSYPKIIFAYDLQGTIKAVLDNRENNSNLYDVTVKFTKYDSIEHFLTFSESDKRFTVETDRFSKHTSSTNLIPAISRNKLYVTDYALPLKNGRFKFYIDYQSRNFNYVEQIIVLIYGRKLCIAYRILVKKEKTYNVIHKYEKEDILIGIDWDKEFKDEIWLTTGPPPL